MSARALAERSPPRTMAISRENACATEPADHHLLRSLEQHLELAFGDDKKSCRLDHPVERRTLPPGNRRSTSADEMGTRALASRVAKSSQARSKAIDSFWSSSRETP